MGELLKFYNCPDCGGKATVSADGDDMLECHDCGWFLVKKKKSWKKIIKIIIIIIAVLFLIYAWFYTIAHRNARVSMSGNILNNANSYNRAAQYHGLEIITNVDDFFDRLCPETRRLFLYNYESPDEHNRRLSIGTRNYADSTIKRSFEFMSFSEETEMLSLDADALRSSMRLHNFIRRRFFS